MDPSREMEELRDRLGQLTQTFFGDLMPMTGAGRGAAWIVPVDVEETDDAYIVDLDLPNVGEEDVEIELRDNELRIFGEYREQERTGVLRRQSRRVGEFEFVIALPGEVDAERVEATLDNGVLHVIAPKATNSQSRRIEVRRGEEQAGEQRAGKSSGQASGQATGQASGQRPDQRGEGSGQRGDQRGEGSGQRGDQRGEQKGEQKPGQQKPGMSQPSASQAGSSQSGAAQRSS